FVYLLDGTRTMPPAPTLRLPTTGATGVALADLDGVGRPDLVFACGSDGTSWNVPSLVFLGDTATWD
ncbi:MAG: hypothetical protein GWN18_15360, partial [Thermoplasmata archaeon]|nr:hypothetical protein [Thermoplasmata archaeon]NIS13442.1 hypothetical protein [Thermoplasmata archaeon]NIS21323.1 hypothetical protein [Thermoplasmata archaeon]NIT78846.1 hypothetical protein [Thermoplasmata archaeon]NIU50376.1 hypothetical protein [Thermoplasmata archaeon]